MLKIIPDLYRYIIVRQIIWSNFFMFHRYDCPIETTIFILAYAQIFNEYSMGIRYLNQLRYVYGNDWSFIVNNIYTNLL